MNDDEQPDFRKSRRNKPTGRLTDRVPPNNQECEQASLGGVMADPRNIDMLIEKFKGVGAEVYYDLRHQTIFSTLLELHGENKPLDVISVQAHLKGKQLLDQCGGIAYLAELPDKGAPSAAEYYADVVLEKYLLRHMAQVCTDIVAGMYDTEGDAYEYLDQAERKLLAVRQLRQVTTVQPMKQLMAKSLNALEDYQQRNGRLLGMPTGFIDYDKLTGGMVDGEMIVIAARPSVGKTSLAMNIADYVATDLRLPVGVFSLEMTSESLAMRLLSSRSRVNLRNAREGFLAERDLPKLVGSAGKLAGSPLWIDDFSPMTVMELRSRARRMHAQYGIKLFVVDYLQLMEAISNKGRRYDNRQQEVAEISKGIKSIAKELKVPVIVLSQLNRDLEREKNRKPRLSDLRESGAIEQDADQICLLYKVPQGDDEKEDPDAIPVNLLIAKQRNGPAGDDVHLTFLKAYTRFESSAAVSDEDVPRDAQQNLV